jgi:hypothetical protein
MTTEQLRYKNGAFSNESGIDANLVLAFGECEEFKSSAFFDALKARYPNAVIAGCSSSGNIMSGTISHDDIVITAVKSEKASFKLVSEALDDTDKSFDVASKLSSALDGDSLAHIIVISEGLAINGTEIARGFNESKAHVGVSGGLAGDGIDFKETFVMANAPASSKTVAAIGIYGDVKIKTGSFAGFDEFGAERKVTKSVGNIIYEIDGEPALDLYKRYLGEEAKELPMSGLYFPISVKEPKGENSVIRTLLAIDDEAKSLTFAGTVEEGSSLKLMKSNIDSLIKNAGFAAEKARDDGYSSGLCLAVSCVGRMIIMKQLVEEELDEVQNILGDKVAVTGFYSYGELAPFEGLKECSLHNQTMTLTVVYE